MINTGACNSSGEPLEGRNQSLIITLIFNITFDRRLFKFISIVCVNNTVYTHTHTHFLVSLCRLRTTASKFPDINLCHIIHNCTLHLLATVQMAITTGLWNESGQTQQVSHTYSVTGMRPIKQLAAVRAQQLEWTRPLAAVQLTPTRTGISRRDVRLIVHRK